MHYTKYAQDGSIAMAADWPFPGSQPVDFEVERGYDGRLYKAGEAPVKPAAEVEAEAFAALRAERDARLAACDWTVLPDAPVAAEEQAAWKAYRQALRDLPQQEDAPWDGGGEQTPWPETPGGEQAQAAPDGDATAQSANDA